MTTPAELFDLTGKTAIVTGGATGIGRQMAEGLAEAGAAVVLCARDGERCEAAAAEIAAATGVAALGLACDTRDKAASRRWWRRPSTASGAIDVLVNNAGTTWAARARGHAAGGLAEGRSTSTSPASSSARRRWAATCSRAAAARS